MEIVEYTEPMIEEVARLNKRLRDGGGASQFPVAEVSKWLPKTAGRNIFQEYFLAKDESGVVRGGYILKHQDFQIGDDTLSIADYQLPLSEGIVEKAYATVGLNILLNALKRQPLLFALGVGGADEPLSRMLAAVGWKMVPLPFLFHVVHPFHFLKNIKHLRKTPARRLLLDAAAYSGAGCCGLKTLQVLRGKHAPRKTSLVVEQVDEFDTWADDPWAACKDHYRMIAVRDSKTLRILYPKHKTKFIRLKILEDGKLLGWCVLLDTQLQNHKHFGAMRLGSFVDGLSLPGNAAKIVAAATAHLRDRGVDLIVSNQSHVSWCEAFDTVGYLRGPSNFLFAASKQLSKLMEESTVASDQIYLNRGDGDGPINL